jgi:hypothetical protein
LTSSSTVEASLPLGDAELLTELCQHCANINTRAAGSTCLVQATVNPGTAAGKDLIS